MSYGAGLEIKGVRIGMTKEEWLSKFGSLDVSYFTVGGALGKYEKIRPVFHEGKLDSFHFFFHSDYFDDVLGAVKTKYPRIRCSKSTVANAMGAKFTQVSCSLGDNTGVLSLSRFVSDIDTSCLSLTSKRFLDEAVKESKKGEKDI